MPGIAGIIGRATSLDRANRLRQMIRSMMHESCYSAGHFHSEELSSWLGWVNLEGSFSDRMPLWNENRDICMLFSGEEYADPDRIADLKKKGHDFELENANYLVHFYEDSGVGFFRDLNGRFCGAILDYRTQRTIVFNDRYGLNRIYYHEKDGELFFSSEAKSLLAILPELRQIDHESLAEAISMGCILRNKSLFTGISLMPAGSIWTFRPGQPVIKGSYFAPEELESVRKRPISDPGRRPDFPVQAAGGGHRKTVGDIQAVTSPRVDKNATPGAAP